MGRARGCFDIVEIGIVQSGEQNCPSPVQRSMMKTWLPILILGFAPLVHAEPELKGTPSELGNYLNTIPKTVLVTGEAEVKVPADRALVTLRVRTENHSLQE